MGPHGALGPMAPWEPPGTALKGKLHWSGLGLAYGVWRPMSNLEHRLSDTCARTFAEGFFIKNARPAPCRGEQIPVKL